MTTKDEEARRRMLNKLMPEAMKERYLLFPIHQNFHWTILVLNIKEGSWKFYNSMKPMGATCKDPYFNVANEVVKMFSLSNLPLIQYINPNPCSIIHQKFIQ